MKPRVTITLSRESLRYVERLARKGGVSRSSVMESLVRESGRCEQELELARLARRFFSKPEDAEESAEREAWLQAGLGTLRDATDDRPPSRRLPPLRRATIASRTAAARRSQA